MTARKTKENDASLPFAALQLLAPPVRLVSAALWKVMEQRDVMHYGVVEEFVTSACETVPGLLTVRHQGKLALGLRARLIMELCSTQPDKKEIMSHLERIRAPAALSTSSATTKKRDLKIMNTVEGFQSLVHSLLTDTTRRKHFFKEEFPVDYGPKFDQELEKLLWEFLIRLDQFFPVPNLAQTVSWLTETPSVLEACARAASQPQLLQTLLRHQTCLGHLETAASLPPNMGDSILTSLSPSGKVPSDPPTGATNSFYQSYNTQTRDKTPFIKPVIGVISNEDVPFMIRTQRGEEQAKDATNEHSNPKENLKFTAIKPKLKDDGTIKGEEQVEEERKESNGMKRKQPDMMESESEEEEEEEEILGMTISGKKRISNTTSERGDDRAALKTCMMQLGVKKLPEDPSLCSLFVSCLRSQPKVILHKLSVSPASPNRTKSSAVKQQNQRRTSPVQTPTRKLNQTRRPGSERPGLDDKETQRGEEQAKDATNEHSNPKENLKFTAIKPKLKDDGTIKGEEQVEEERKESNGMKRKQPDMMESESEEEEEEEEILGMTISGKKRISNTTSERGDDRAALKTCMMQLGVKKLPEDPSLCSLFVSCLRSQPKVILHKLSVSPASPNRTKSSSVKQQNQRRTSPVQTPTRKLNQTRRPGSERPGLDDKETQRGEEQAKDATNEHSNPKENLKFTAIKPKLKDDGTIKGEEQVEEERKESNGMKRKQPDMMESESEEEEEEEEILGMTISGKKRISNTTSERGDDRAALKTCMMQLGVKKLPEDPSLCSLFVSCLRSQPKVILHKLSVSPASPNRTKSSSVKQQNQRRTSPVQTPTRKLNQTRRPGSERPGLDDKETQRGEEQAKDATNEHSNPKENLKSTAIKPKLKDDGTIKGEEQVEEERKESNGMKRKQPDMMESESEEEEEEEEEILGMTISGKKRISNTTSERGDDRAALKTCMMQLGVKKLPEDPSLCSLFVSCLRSQPKVILHKLSVSPASPNRTKSSAVKQQNQRRTSPVQTPTRKLNQTRRPGSERPGLDDKENHPVLPGVIGSPSQQRSNSGTSARPGDTEDYVADSEDEATKNFKVRLFTKRYYKTKHGTYVPTLREYWKPGMTRRDLSSAGGKNRR
ncbi:hypothetical protein OYC64_004323 [Pagothenia borchgrevinki]|uniref:TERF1-interacting nuclear factor 2 N-terminal domain-containing protein n=1 Tax=Pagothenia borchgrevinki TaxID=8213 RepID=A0ABD2FWV8_PAGBO